MRIVFGTILGLIIAIIIIGVMNVVSKSFYQADLIIDPADLDDLRSKVDQIPAMSMIFVIMAHFFAIVFGTAFARFITGGSKMPGYIIGGLIVINAIVNMIAIFPPMWFVVADFLLLLIAVWLGMKISKKRKQHETNHHHA